MFEQSEIDMNNTVDNDHRDEGAFSFYPAVIAVVAGHPTSAKFIVVEAGHERGRGLKSKQAFHKDEQVTKLSVV